MDMKVCKVPQEHDTFKASVICKSIICIRIGLDRNFGFLAGTQNH